MKTIRTLIAVMLVAMITLTAAYALNKGDKAPDFTLKTIDGKTLSLSAVRKGTTKVVLLDFWATWCGPCKAEMPHIQKLHEKYGRQGLKVVGLAGYREGVDDIKGYLKEKKITYTNVIDKDNTVIRQYGVRGLPTMLMIDKNGTIQKVHIGYTEPQVLESEIKALLK